MKTGILIINLGTPEAPETGPVRRYLREFLGDPRVLDITAWGRWLLLNLIILPFRPKKSAEAYRKIWTDRGSPLLFNTLDFTEKLRASLPADGQVEFAMRYGRPSLESKLDLLLAESPEELVILPMYPQYSSASTGSTLEKVFSLLAAKWNVPTVRVIGPFYNDAGFLDACAAIAKENLAAFAPDHVILSYHGLPERQIRKSESAPGHCLASDDACCAAITARNRFCYRAQCFETSRGLAQRLGLAPSGYTVCFQSRLGRTPWIKPYTDQVVAELGRQGKKRLLVLEPSFTADCLETLEEITLRAQATFSQAGGGQLRLAPSLNASDAWVRAVRDLIFPK
ncbi:MAG: ferrochelatase [Fibrobacteria bacterium]